MPAARLMRSPRTRSNPAVAAAEGAADGASAGALFCLCANWYPQGSLYYAFAVIAGPMATEMGWSSPGDQWGTVGGTRGYGLPRSPAGRAIDIMASGVHDGGIDGRCPIAPCLIASHGALAALFRVDCHGAVFSTVLYEPVFAVMAREAEG